MTKIIFENDSGQLRLGGGGDDAWRVTEISGCGMSAKTFQTAVYFAEAGHKTLSEKRDARVITIAGDVCGGAVRTMQRVSQAVRILDEPGWLTVRSSGKVRRIKARCTSFEQGGRYGEFQRFAMQFCCDCPYFEDVGSNSIALFEKTKEIKTTFTLPQIFSSRTSKGTVINSGDVEAEPVFDIYFGMSGADGEKFALTLYNETTQKKLVLSLTQRAGESVTVDIANRRIYNDSGDNLISALSDESVLSSFVLKKGANIISAVSDAEADLSIVCRFTNRYLEAVC